MMAVKLGRNDPCHCGSGKKYKSCCLPKAGSNPPSLQPAQGEIDQLIALYDNRRFAELETRSNVLASRYPDSGVAWKLLGASLRAQGKDALFALKKAVELNPRDAMLHNSLGNAYKEIGQFEDAIASYNKVLKMEPGYAGAYNNLGVALKDSGHVARAEESFQQALKLQPEFAGAHHNLASLLGEQGKYAEAALSCRRALELGYNDPEAYNVLGVALRWLGQLDEAISNYRRALELNPGFPEAYNNLGVALMEMGSLQDAIECYRKAIELKSDYVEAHNNLGIALKEIGQLDAAVTSCQRALELKPDYAEAYNNLGNNLMEWGLLDEALTNYRKVLELKPDFLEARSNLLFALNSSDAHPSAYLEEVRKYGRNVAAKAEPPFASWHCADAPQRIKVGIVSGDLRKHPVGYFLESILAQFKNGRIELLAYPTTSRSDELSTRIKPFFSAWKPLAGLSDQAAADMIHDDGIHVLLDLSGHTGHNRLPVFGWRPAPVQATWLGYLNSTGIQAMDYIIADPWAIPQGEESQFTETPWRLPETYICFSQPEVAVEVGSLPAQRNGYVTFGSFNNLRKVNDRVVACWARVLHAVPGSKLYFKAKVLNSPGVREKLVSRFSNQGIDEERLQMAGTFPSREDHFRAYQQVDIALDPFPYPGITTTVEGLWMAVPTMAMKGDRFLSHQGETILHNAGLPEWIAEDEDDYVNKAVRFSVDLEQLSALREGLREKAIASPLFDAQRFARNFEDALWGMWRERGNRAK